MKLNVLTKLGITLAIIAGCGGGGSNASSPAKLPATVARTQAQANGVKAAFDAQSRILAAAPAQQGAPPIPSSVDFSKTNCAVLAEAQLESYVDPRIVGRTRELALADMRLQPRCNRHNVEEEDDDGNDYSNSWEIMQEKKGENRLQPLGNGEFRDPTDGFISVVPAGYSSESPKMNESPPSRPLYRTNRKARSAATP